MKTMLHRPTLAVALAILALVAVSCRGADEPAVTEPTDEPAATDAAEEPTGTEEPAVDGEVAADVGVTEEPCPNAVNPDNGCVYLGIISDLTEGPFAALAVPITDAQKAFWQRVNEDGGIGGYDIDVTTYIRDNKYNPEVHNQVYQEIKGEVLGLAQTLGSPTTAAIIDDLRTNNIVGAPASWTSAWAFEDVIIESGTNYCFESMNAIDYAVEQLDTLETVMAVHYPGDYGDDAAAGAQVAAEANGLTFIDQPTAPGQENQGEAIGAIVEQSPDVVIITTGPTDMATVVGQAAAQGYTGRFIGTGPTWNPALLQSPAAEAIQGLFWLSYYWEPWGGDTPGHQAMRDALSDVEPNDGYTVGWVWQYPLKAALERAAELGDLTREGLLAAVQSLDSVDYEGMLPAEAGNFAGDPNDTVFRQALILEPDPEAETGITTIQPLFAGPTAEAHEFTGPCFESL